MIVGTKNPHSHPHPQSISSRAHPTPGRPLRGLFPSLPPKPTGLYPRKPETTRPDSTSPVLRQCFADHQTACFLPPAGCQVVFDLWVDRVSRVSVTKRPTVCSRGARSLHLLARPAIGGAERRSAVPWTIAHWSLVTCTGGPFFPTADRRLYPSSSRDLRPYALTTLRCTCPQRAGSPWTLSTRPTRPSQSPPRTVASLKANQPTTTLRRLCPHTPAPVQTTTTRGPSPARNGTQYRPRPIRPGRPTTPLRQCHKHNLNQQRRRRRRRQRQRQQQHQHQNQRHHQHRHHPPPWKISYRQ